MNLKNHFVYSLKKSPKLILVSRCMNKIGNLVAPGLISKVQYFSKSYLQRAITSHHQKFHVFRSSGCVSQQFNSFLIVQFYFEKVNEFFIIQSPFKLQTDDMPNKQISCVFVNPLPIANTALQELCMILSTLMCALISKCVRKSICVYKMQSVCIYVHKNKNSLQKGFGNHSECLFHNKINNIYQRSQTGKVKSKYCRDKHNPSMSSSVLKYWEQNCVINITEQTRLQSVLYNI